MKLIIIFCALVALALSSVEVERWQKTEDDSLYFIETEQKFNWFEALHECARMKMYLAAVETFSKHLQIYTLMKTKFNQIEVKLWLGGHDNAATGNYIWVATGEALKLSYNNWDTKRPDSSTEHCVAICSKAVGWDDIHCSRKFVFICEISPLLRDRKAEVKALLETCGTQTTQLMERTERIEAGVAIQKFGEAALLLNETNGKLANSKTTLELPTNQLKMTGGESEALKISNELLAEKITVLDAVMKSYENRTVSNKYYNFVLHVHAQSK